MIAELDAKSRRRDLDRGVLGGADEEGPAPQGAPRESHPGPLSLARRAAAGARRGGPAGGGRGGTCRRTESEEQTRKRAGKPAEQKKGMQGRKGKKKDRQSRGRRGGRRQGRGEGAWSGDSNWTSAESRFAKRILTRRTSPHVLRARGRPGTRPREVSGGRKGSRRATGVRVRRVGRAGVSPPPPYPATTAWAGCQRSCSEALMTSSALFETLSVGNAARSLCSNKLPDINTRVDTRHTITNRQSHQHFKVHGSVSATMKN